MEVLIVDGMSSDNTRVLVNEYCEKYSFLKLLDNPQKIVPNALNIGIRMSKGEVIIRLDAHCKYPTNYFLSLTSHLFELDAENVGCIIKTLPENNSSKAKAIAIGMSHPFGVGNSYFRIGTEKIKEVDTVPFGCYKREIFNRIGYFDEDLVRNQDDEFNGRIIKNGGKIFIIPDLVIDYYARNNITKMVNMFYQYGLFKPFVNSKLGKPATVRQFFPFLFVLGLIVGLFLSFTGIFFLILYLSILLIYFMLSLYFSSIEAIKKKNYKLLFFLPNIFLVTHLSYGWGYLLGIYHFLILGKTNSNIKINR
jgi:glycosyltransferase involved in cell wall biosynthesis